MKYRFVNEPDSQEFRHEFLDAYFPTFARTVCLIRKIEALGLIYDEKTQKMVPSKASQEELFQERYDILVEIGQYEADQGARVMSYEKVLSATKDTVCMIAEGLAEVQPNSEKAQMIVLTNNDFGFDFCDGMGPMKKYYERAQALLRELEMDPADRKRYEAEMNSDLRNAMVEFARRADLCGDELRDWLGSSRVEQWLMSSREERKTMAEDNQHMVQRKYYDVLAAIEFETRQMSRALEKDANILKTPDLSEGTSNTPSPLTPSNVASCAYCHQLGHISDLCPVLREELKRQQAIRKQARDKSAKDPFDDSLNGHPTKDEMKEKWYAQQGGLAALEVSYTPPPSSAAKSTPPATVPRNTKWCNRCKINTHNDANCKLQNAVVPKQIQVQTPTPAAKVTTLPQRNTTGSYMWCGHCKTDSHRDKDCQEPDWQSPPNVPRLQPVARSDKWPKPEGKRNPNMTANPHLNREYY